jgi:hypothetical protein
MKYLKMLGLAAIAAMGLMAFLGAGSASATVLCTTNSNPCGASWHYTGTIHATLKAGTTAILKDTSGIVSDTCPESTIHIESTTTGSSSTTPVGEFPKGSLTWSNSCSNTTTTTAGGSLEIHATDDNGNGTITAKNAKVTIVIGPVSCTFGAGAGINLGTYTASTKTLVINTVVEKVEGSFACPSTGKWTGEYVLTTPANLYAATS